MNEKIEHEGIIFRKEGKKAWVNIVQNSACSGCHAKSVCHLSEKKEKTIEIPDVDDSYHEGDKVIIVGNSSLGLRAVLYAFVIPLALVVLILAFCFYYFNSESIAALSALAGLTVYFLLLYTLRDKFKKKFVFTIQKEFEGVI